MKKLVFNQMENVQGGNCSTLTLIAQNNCLEGGALAGAVYGWGFGNCGPISNFWSAYAQGCS